MGLDIGKMVVDSQHTEEVVRTCVEMLRPINAGLQKGITEGNMGIIGQQQANIALVYGILVKLDEKLSGKRAINAV